MKGKFFKKIKKAFKRSRGYTLIEIAAVVAVTATLAAVVIPVALNKIEAARKATAADDVKALGSAVAGFFADTGEWPARESSGDLDNHYEALVTGDDSADLNGNFASTLVSLAHDHLVENLEGYDTTGSAKWEGPYTESLKNKEDPWGEPYVIWVEAMHTTGTENGWVISSGPDMTFDTATTDITISDDDIGFVLYTHE